MGVIKRVKIIKPHASGWPFIAIIALSGFMMGTVFGIPFMFSICFVLVGIYLFRKGKGLLSFRCAYQPARKLARGPSARGRLVSISYFLGN